VELKEGRKDFFQAGGSALCQGAAAARGFCLIHDWRPASPSPGCAGSWGWPQWLTTPGASGRRTQGPRAPGDAVITLQIQGGVPAAPWLLRSPRVHQEVGCCRPPRSGATRGQASMRPCPQLQPKPARHSAPAARQRSVPAGPRKPAAAGSSPRLPIALAGDITYTPHQRPAGGTWPSGIDLFKCARVRRMETRQPESIPPLVIEAAQPSPRLARVNPEKLLIHYGPGQPIPGSD